MAKTRSFSSLRDDAYKAADLEGFTDRYTATEVGRYINQGIPELWDMLVAARGYSYFGKPYYTMGAVSSSGTTPPTVTVTGVPRIGTATSFVLHVDITTGGVLSGGGVVFRYSIDGGSTWRASSQSAPTSGTYYITDLGLTITFADGTYNADNLYISTAGLPTTTANVSTYALPTDFYKLHRLWLTDGSSMVVEPELVESSFEPSYRAQSPMEPHSFQIRDGYFDLLPTPASSYTINLWYVPTAPTLVNDTDTFDGINGWEDYAVFFAARRMAMKEGDVEIVNLLQQDMNKLAARITGMAADRDQATARKVQDVRGALWFAHRSGRARGRRYFPRS